MKKLFALTVFIIHVYVLCCQNKSYLLLEHFSNTTVNTVVTPNQLFYSTIYPFNLENIHHITFHVPDSSDLNSWYCPFYIENTSDNNGHFSTYPSIDYLPQMVINGNVLSNQTDLVTQYQLDSALLSNTSNLFFSKVKYLPSTLGNNFYDVFVEIKTDGTIDTSINYILKTAVIESSINYASTNGETVHRNVMRKMLPDFEGQVFNPAANGSAVIYPYFNVAFDNIWNTDSICILSWVVNESNGKVINSGSSKDPQALDVVLNNSISIHTVSCNANCDAQLKIDMEGGQAPYSVEWIPNLGSSDFIENLCAGTYSVFVTDALGDSDSIENIIIFEPPAITVSYQTLNDQDTTCTAAIFASLNGGMEPISTTWHDINGNIIDTNTLNLTNICSGQYILTAVDGQGCVFIDTVLASSFDSGCVAQINAIQHISCTNLNDGSIDVFVFNSIGTIDFEWTDANGNLIAETEDLDSLSAGFYYLTATDNIGQVCNLTVEIENPAPLSGSLIINEDYANYCGGSASISVIGGNPPYIIQWEPNSVNIIGPTLPNLCAGEYEVLVTDNNFCTYSETFSLAVIDPIFAFSINDTSSISCHDFNDGSIDFTIIGGFGATTVNWAVTDSVGLTSTLPQFANLLSVDSLSEGIYTITVTDSLLNTSSFQFQIQNPDPLNLVVETVPYCFGNDGSEILGAAEAFVSGGTGAYHYFWNMGDTVSNVSLSPGIYALEVMDDNNCSVAENAVVIDTINPNSCFTTYEDHHILKDFAYISATYNNTITIEFKRNIPSTFEFYLFDAQGKLIFKKTNSTIGAIHQIKVPRHLSPGIYIAKVNALQMRIEKKIALWN